MDEYDHATQDMIGRTWKSLLLEKIQKEVNCTGPEAVTILSSLVFSVRSLSLMSGCWNDRVREGDVDLLSVMWDAIVESNKLAPS